MNEKGPVWVCMTCGGTLKRLETKVGPVYLHTGRANPDVGPHAIQQEVMIR